MKSPIIIPRADQELIRQINIRFTAQEEYNKKLREENRLLKERVEKLEYDKRESKTAKTE